MGRAAFRQATPIWKADVPSNRLKSAASYFAAVEAVMTVSGGSNNRSPFFSYCAVVSFAIRPSLAEPTIRLAATSNRHAIFRLAFAITLASQKNGRSGAPLKFPVGLPRILSYNSKE